MIDLSDGYDAILDNGLEMINYYRNDPVAAAYDLLNVDLAPVQRIVLRDMWHKNYTISVCGRGFGKSIHINSLSHIEGVGLVHLNEILPPVPSYLNDGDDEVIEYNLSILTDKKFKPSKRLCLEKNIEGKRLETQNGFVHKGTGHHPLLTLENNGSLVYKTIDEFVIGDRVCIQRNQEEFGVNEIPHEDSYLVGLFIGDGSIGNNSVPNITTEDDDIKSFCIEYCCKHDILYRIDNDKRTKNTSKIVFKNLESFFEKYNIGRTLSYDKTVPYSVRTATRGSQVAFLQGYFDTDGTVHNTNGGVSCCSVSKKLLQEIQIMLLNFGIMSRLREKKTNSEFGRVYLLDMFSEDAFKFKELIGFRLDRKQKILDEYFSKKELNLNKDTIPHVKELCIQLYKDYRDRNSKIYNDSSLPYFRLTRKNSKELTYYKLIKFVEFICSVKGNYSIDEVIFSKLIDIVDKYYYFDTVVSISDWKGDCYDFEMDMLREPNYFANGFINHNTFLLGTNAALHALLYPGYRVGLIAPSFRQSKMIFAEVEKLYARSPIFRDAAEKRPTRGSDTCFLKLKSTDKSNGSFIEALPIGVDGAKIRGSRFYLIEIDELAQMPSQIIDMVIRPMAAVSLEPMQKVREVERIQKLIEQGLATEDDLNVSSANKMIMTSSGYFKFNHMWKRMKSYWKAIKEEGEKTKFAVHQIPYKALPKGFLDEKNIDEANRTMSSIEFAMEYEAAMVSDSDGFFKASLIEARTQGSNFNISISGDPSKEYVLGIDPNQGGNALCGVVVIELGSPNKIVFVKGLKNKTTQDMTSYIQDLVFDKFNIVHIFMDSQGGGKPVRDLLQEGYGERPKILDVDDETTKHERGKRILKLVNPTSQWIADANFDTLALLENDLLRFPEPPIDSLDLSEKLYEEVKLLKSQMTNIIVTQTARGVRHFDTPKKGQNKDLYSAVVLAAWGARELARNGEEQDIVLQAAGLVRAHRGGASFSSLGVMSSSKAGIRAALLKRKD